MVITDYVKQTRRLSIYITSLTIHTFNAGIKMLQWSRSICSYLDQRQPPTMYSTWTTVTCFNLQAHQTVVIKVLIVKRTKRAVHAWCCCIRTPTVSTSPSTDLASDRYDSAVDNHASNALTISDMPSGVTRSMLSAFLSRLYNQTQHYCLVNGLTTTTCLNFFATVC